jgi:hypothetical protein
MYIKRINFILNIGFKKMRKSIVSKKKEVANIPFQCLFNFLEAFVFGFGFEKIAYIRETLFIGVIFGSKVVVQ